MRREISALAVAVACACCGTEVEREGFGAPTSESDPNPDPDPEPLPQPEAIDPCTLGACWESEFAAPLCTTVTEEEDFSSGSYNVHSYRAVAWSDALLHVTLRRDAGAWTPALVLRDVDGRTLFDGAIGLMEDGWAVTLEATTEDEVTIAVSTAQTSGIEIVVTSLDSLKDGPVSGIDTEADYTLSLTGECGVEAQVCEANGHLVPQVPCAWLHLIGRRVVPRLIGTRDERIEAAARVAWWSLKEGVLFLDNPLAYSNCNFSNGGDTHIGPLDECEPGQAWQVGLSGVQAAYLDTVTVEATAAELYPERTLDEIFVAAAAEGGLGSESTATILSGSDDLRRSWLLRESGIAFTHQVTIVTSECIDNELSWCFGSGWPSTAQYAPNRNGALQTIADIQALFEKIAP